VSAGRGAQEVYDLWKPQEHLIGDGDKVDKNVYRYVGDKDLAVKKFVRKGRTTGKAQTAVAHVRHTQNKPERRVVSLVRTSSPYCRCHRDNWSSTVPRGTVDSKGVDEPSYQGCV
jgi:hypothetical protein